MVLPRSPTKPSAPPTARLAAVTRRANEIDKILSEVPLNLPEVKALFNDYLVKVENLIQACGTVHKEWLSNHNSSISEFRGRIENVLRPYESFREDPKSIKTRTSVSGTSRAVSQVKIELAKEKANIQAEKASLHLRNTLKFKEMQLNIQHQKELFDLKQDKEQIEVFEAERRIESLEKELSKLELDHCSIQSEEPQIPISAQVSISPQPPLIPTVPVSVPFSTLVSDNLIPRSTHRPILNYSTPFQFERNPAPFQSPFVRPTAPTQLTASRSTPVVNPANDTIQPSENESKLVEILRAQTEATRQIISHQERADLPKKTLEPFDGTDMTKFKPFILSFERIIESRCPNYDDKLLYLEQYTKGKAQRLVKSCSHHNSTVAYAKAKELLTAEYGNEFRISSKYIEKLTQWPTIKNDDGDGLQEFLIFLLDCQNYLENMSHNNQLQSPQEIMNVIIKLPYRMRERFRRTTSHLLKTNGRVEFKDVVNFISDEVDVLRQPLFSQINDNGSRYNTVKKTLCTTSHEVHEENIIDLQNQKFCEYCKKYNHYISYCRIFGKLLHDQKIKYLQTNKLCSSCLRKQHNSNYCPVPVKCKKCSNKHPTILHRNLSEPAIKTPHSAENSVQFSQSFASKISTVRGNIRSPIVPAKIKIANSSTEIIVYCALDTHSTDCWIREDIVDKLGVRTEPVSIKVKSMTSLNDIQKSKVLNNLTLSSLDNSFTTSIPVMYTKPKKHWPFSESDLPRSNDLEEYPHLKNLSFPECSAEIGILIGMNAPELLMPLEVITGDAGTPYATRHSLGWTVNGPVNSGSGEKKCNRLNVSHVDCDLESQIENLFAQDFVDHNNEKSYSQDDRLWLEKVESSIKLLPNNKYEIDLPFKNDVCFPNNKVQAYNMFLNSINKFNKNKAYFDDYNKFMQSMIDNHFMELVPVDELIVEPGKCFFLVHHAVHHKRKHKLRVVFNCSLKYKNVSLNDYLLQGPDLTSNLFGVLMRFRQRPVALMADIEKMYYQIRVPNKHANFMRLFWFDCVSGEVVQYRLKVHVFGAKSSPSVANYALKQTVKFCEDEAVKFAIRKNFYVDDLLISFDCSDDAIDKVKTIKNTVSSGGFNLTSFSSNSSPVLNTILPGDLSNQISRTLSCQDSNLDKALGVTWNKSTDTLGFDVDAASINSVTKREILKVVASIYDPIGLCSPVLVTGKKLFQEACKLKVDWDFILSESFQNAWKKWLYNIQQLNNYSIPRCLQFNISFNKVEMHIFVDGSETAYGTVAYCKFIYDNNQCNVSFLASKSRLTPLNNRTLKTVPRIELCSAKLGVELSMKLARELDYKFNNTFYYSDSTTVLSYIKSDTIRFHRFVDNKICFIRNYSDCADWYHVPSRENPADLLSRGVTVSHLVSSEMWKRGPNFLKHNHLFPEQRALNLPVDDPEIKRETFALVCESEAMSPTDILINSSSSWHKLKLRVSYFIKFISWLKSGRKKISKLSVKNMADAELAIISYEQHKYFPREIECISRKTRLNKTSSIRKLLPFMKQSLLRVGGRLKNANVIDDVKYPIILPSKSYAIKLYVDHVHKVVGHLGRENMLSTIRRKYWLLKGSSVVRKTISNCFHCKKCFSKPTTQLMAELPYPRVVSDLPAFTNVGVDYFGPFIVTHGRKTEKRYGAIFSCMSSRAIHLEMSHSLTTDSFINALRRFICRRGNVKCLYSDNGTNFVGSSRELENSIREWNLNSIDSWLQQRNIQWNFNTPYASHHGGFFEREIRSVRKILSSMLSEQVIKLNDENLCTIFCEIEAILNNRPLSEVSSDHTDIDAITPNNLLLLNAGVTFPPGLFNPRDCYSKRKWRQVQYLVNLFWSRWRREYLVLLQSRIKWLNVERSYKTGDLVLVMDIQLPRNQWPLGRIMEIIADRSNLVRSVKIKISRCKNRNLQDFSTTVITRPISKIICLRHCEEL